MKITQIRNATLIIEYNNNKFLIDPWLGPKNYMPGFDTAINAQIRQPRVELPFAINEIVNVDAVIVTHVHPDHWDEFAEKALDKNIKIFVQSDYDKNFMNSKGFTNIELISPNGTEFNGIKLFKTSCQHGKREIIEPLCKSINMPYDSMGVVYTAESEKTLYLAGDSIYCDEVEDALKTYNPDIVIINSCGATLLNGERIIMDKEDVNKILRTNPDKTVIASHMDTVSHLSVTREDLRKLIQEKGFENLLIPEDGETIII